MCVYAVTILKITNFSLSLPVPKAILALQSLCPQFTEENKHAWGEYSSSAFHSIRHLSLNKIVPVEFLHCSQPQTNIHLYGRGSGEDDQSNKRKSCVAVDVPQNLTTTLVQFCLPHSRPLSLFVFSVKLTANVVSVIYGQSTTLNWRKSATPAPCGSYLKLGTNYLDAE